LAQRLLGANPVGDIDTTAGESDRFAIAVVEGSASVQPPAVGAVFVHEPPLQLEYATAAFHILVESARDPLPIAGMPPIRVVPIRAVSRARRLRLVAHRLPEIDGVHGRISDGVFAQVEVPDADLRSAERKLQSGVGLEERRCLLCLATLAHVTK